MSARAVRRVDVAEKDTYAVNSDTILMPDGNLPVTIAQKLHNDLFVDFNVGTVKSQALEVPTEDEKKDDVFGDFYISTKHGMATYDPPQTRCCCIATPTDTVGNRCCSFCYKAFSFIPQLPCLVIQGVHSLVQRNSNDEEDLESHNKNLKEPWNTMLIREFNKFWSTGDISDKDVDQYKQAVQQTFADWQSGEEVSEDTLEDIQAELEQIAINGYIGRMQVCIELIDFTKAVVSKYIFATTVMACLYGNEDIAIAVAGAAKENAVIIMEDGPYAGTSPLHFAIYNNSKTLLQTILPHMNQEQKRRLFHDTTYGDTVLNKMPYIEKMLNLAVYEAGPDIIALLVEEGAEMHMQDSHGYNPFHICCILGKHQQSTKAVLAFDALIGSVDQWLNHTQSFKSLRDEDEVHARDLLLYRLFKTEDNEGLTPLKLAAKYGQKALMERMLNIVNLYKFPHTKLGSMTRAYFDVSEIDPVLSHHSNKPSVLELLIMTEPSEHKDNSNMLECISIPIINRLVEQKWQLVMPFFTFWCLWHMLVLVLSSYYAVSYLFPQFQIENVTNGVNVHQDGRFVLGAWDVPLLVNTTMYLLYYIAVCIVVIQIQRRVKIHTVKQFMAGVSVMELKILLSYIFTVLLYYLLRILSNEYDVIAMGTSLFLGWLSVLFFTRAYRASGIFTIIISEVLYKDLIRFLLVIILMDVGFSLATLSIQAASTQTHQVLPGVGSVFLDYFKLALTINDYSAISQIEAGIPLLMLYLCYLLACSLLLLNMMIGAMSETYAFLSGDGENIWKRVRTRDAIVMEWTLPRCTQLYVSSIQEHRIVQIQLKDGTFIERHFYLASTKPDGDLED